MTTQRSSAGEWLYRSVLKLYPSELRRAHETDMLSLFRELENDAGPSVLRRARLLARAILDVVRTSVRAHRHERRRVIPVRKRPRGWFMSTWKHDIVAALRFLRKQPGFTFVAAATLALGIGANTAIFSVLYGVLLRPLGIDDASAVAVVQIYRASNPNDGSGFFVDYLDDVRDAAEASGIARVTSYVYESITLAQEDRVNELGNAVMVDGDFFDVMGVTAVMGRTLMPEDVPPNRRGNVCVISETLWRGQFGSDPAIVGTRLNLDDEPVDIVGVIPADVPLPSSTTTIWMPQGWDPSDVTMRGRLNVMARLSDSSQFEQAQAFFAVLASELGSEYPRFEGYTMSVVGLRESIVGSVRPAIFLAAVAVSLILLIACANTANLLLSRAAMRSKEIATRQAMGARTGQLACQLLAESLALALLGGALGVLAAFGIHRVLLVLAPAYLPRLSSVQLDVPVLLFSLILTLVTGLVFGLVPLVHILKSRGGVSGSLNIRTGERRGWLSHALVVGQVTLSVVLLVAAGLMVRSLLELHRVPLGFDVTGVAGARIYLDDDAYPEDAQQEQYFRTLVENLRARSDIDVAGASSGLPMDPVTIDYDLPYTLPGQERTEDDVAQSFFRTITPGYLETMRIPLREGRLFDSRDRADTQPVALINESFARVAWGDTNPIDRSFFIYGGRRELRVVGVVGDVHFAGPSAAYKPEFFVPHTQVSYSAMTVVARSRDASAGAQAIAEEALRIDRRQPVSGTFTMDGLVAGAVSTDRFLTWLLVAFGCTALLISAAGIYGVISYWVDRSRRDLGVRMACGASVEDIVRMVLGRGLGLSLAGVVLGLTASVLVSKLLARFLYGVSPNDWLAIITVIVLLGGTAMLASFVPAWRAAHVDPVRSLHAD